ncbi:nucleotidyltransferase family protein [Salmonirosea aquatica]|uniref:DNA polymerase subunit beta n=1 Tax=Salmonirosea aquatica TaxID=2654236 RepID=A0A7C9FDT7_9BACT|nr:DNA polymerase subunit beta [Cytophagaceae bacterium SJW1-29]
MELPSEIKLHFDELTRLCEKYSVHKLYSFGSINTDHFDHEKSDVDLWVELEPMPPLEKGEKLMNLWDDLEVLFSRKVDLLTEQPLKNPILQQSIEKNKRLIYERKGKKVPG